MKIREATVNDIPQMVFLSEEKRTIYETYQPVFWRKAGNSAEVQTKYFESLLVRDNHISIVCEEEQEFTGFLIGAVISAPPVYDPGGKSCMIDDFCISASAQWENEGNALLEVCKKKAALLGTVQLVIVCGREDEAKRAFLSDSNLTVASEWYTCSI